MANKEATDRMTVVVRSHTPLLMNAYIGEQPSRAKIPPGKKTQQHIEAQRRAGFFQAAYHDEEGFYIKGEAIDRMLCNGAMRFRKGQDFKAGVFCEQHKVRLRIFDGPEDNKGRLATGSLEEYYGDGKTKYVDVRGVVIKKSRVDRCRPYFPHWGLEFTVVFETEFVTKAEILAALDRNSLGDFRPRFGRFKVLKSS